MSKLAAKLLILTIVSTVSTLAVAGSNKGSHSLASKIESKLTGVAPNTVIVSVDESEKKATLRGSVSSQAEVDRLTRLVSGVTGVRVIGTDLRVSTTTSIPGTSMSTTGTTTMSSDMSGHTTMGNSSLAAQIHARFLDLSPNTVVVVVDEATKSAYVRGNLPSQIEVDRVTNTISGIRGLRVVDTNLAAAGSVMDHTAHSGMSAETTTMSNDVHSMSDMDADVTTSDEGMTITTRTISTSDASLRAAIEAALRSEGIQGQSKIAVNTENGVVTLTGSALSESHADRIVALAMSVPGVVRVEPNITLRDQKRRYQVKPSFDRDKKGFEVGSPESRVDEDRKGDVDVDVDVDTPDPVDGDDDDNL